MSESNLQTELERARRNATAWTARADELQSLSDNTGNNISPAVAKPRKRRGTSTGRPQIKQAIIETAHRLAEQMTISQVAEKLHVARRTLERHGVRAKKKPVCNL